MVRGEGDRRKKGQERMVSFNLKRKEKQGGKKEQMEKRSNGYHQKKKK